MMQSQIYSMEVYRFYTLFLLFLLSACGRSQNMDSVKHGLSAENLRLSAQLEDQGKEHIHMPALPTGYSSDRYINVPSGEISALTKSKVVLIDIWDYTCVNCIRTLPYIKQWADKYKDKGLVVVGVHSPEFEFEKQPKNLLSAINRLGLGYPIIADNEFEIWNSLANKYWPAKYLFDEHGILRTTHFGEGEYQEFEAFLQKILLERDSTLALPPLDDLVRSTDKPGAVCYRPTPETYLGFSRNHPGNTEVTEPGKVVKFSLPKKLDEDRLYFEGSWQIEREFAQPSGDGMSKVLIDYQAKEVNLVIHPQGKSNFKVLIEQDGKPVNPDSRGTDLVEENGRTFIFVSEPRMYNLINNSKFGHFFLRLTSGDPALGAFAFSFTSDCKE